jgi:hypothetical protein
VVPAEKLLRIHLERGSSGVASAEPDTDRSGGDEDLA